MKTLDAWFLETHGIHFQDWWYKENWPVESVILRLGEAVKNYVDYVVKELSNTTEHTTNKEK